MEISKEHLEVVNRILNPYYTKIDKNFKVSFNKVLCDIDIRILLEVIDYLKENGYKNELIY